ncbi:MAG: AMP-binding protein, partial [Oscillospiraceae bacterium]|nr:AMP-binding protein [Oscillospiraceae bacterium]
FEYFTALLYGRTLVLLTDSERNDYATIGSLIEKHPDSSIFLTASEVESYLREEQFREQFRHLAVLVLAGEMIQESTREKVQALASPETSLLSLYGSTECHAIAWSNLRNWEAQGGVSCQGVRIELLDEAGNPIAILEADQEIPKTWLRDEEGSLMLDQKGNPVATQTVPAAAVYVQTLRDQLDPNRSIDIYVTFENDHAILGNTASFVAVLNGYDSLIYTLQWQQIVFNPVKTCISNSGMPQLVSDNIPK